MGDIVLGARGVGVRYGERWILRGLDLDIRRGEIVALLGGSGSGKSTLMHQIIGLETPQEGEIRLFGSPIQAGNMVARRGRLQRLGVLFQHGALFSAFNVFENIAFPLLEQRVLPRDAIRDVVMTRLAMVELGPQDAWRLPAELSGGMVKRVALARALALDPEVLLLDEPTAGLDPERGEKFVRLVRMLCEELNLTVLMVTHDVDTLVDLATRVAVLAEGRIVADGTLADLRANPPHPFVARFLGCERSRRALAGLGG